MANINTNGTVNGTLLLEYIKEPDGSIWEPVFYHKNPTGQLFSSSDSFATGVVKNDTMFFNFNVCKELTSWEFLCIQRATENTAYTKYRWIQTKSPFTATWADVKPGTTTKITTSGYTDVGAFGGFYVLNSNTYMVTANGSNGNWWGATGCWTSYDGGLPGYGGAVVKTGDMAVFVRIDGTNLTATTKIYPSTGIVVANNFINK